MAKILIVEDESPIREMVRFALEGAGFDVGEAAHVVEAREQIRSQSPDLILLDWMLAGRSGLEFAEELKRHKDTRAIPIIILTARSDEQDKVQGLDIGADDYVTKPFSPRELVSRINAVLRRYSSEGDEANRLEFKGVCLERDSHRVKVDGQSVDISPTEFRLLEFFMTHDNRAFTRAQLLDKVWGDNVYVEERTVDVHIRRLRKVLEPGGYDKLVQTVRGVGYRFSDKD